MGYIPFMETQKKSPDNNVIIVIGIVIVGRQYFWCKKTILGLVDDFRYNYKVMPSCGKYKDVLNISLNIFLEFCPHHSPLVALNTDYDIYIYMLMSITKQFLTNCPI